MLSGSYIFVLFNCYEQLVTTEELLSLEILKPENIRGTLHAYQLAKRCNEKRVMYVPTPKS